jgi:alpha-L-rhamnosidase
MSLSTHSRVVEVRAGGRGAPRFASSPTPSVSWRVETDAEGWAQARATIEGRRGDTVERHEIVGAESASIAWPFEPLSAYERVEIRVIPTGVDGVELPASDWALIEAGPLVPADWSAAFIASVDDASGDSPNPATVKDGASSDEVRAALRAETADRGTSRFRRELTIERPIVRALLSYTAHGVVEFTIDGEPVSDELLAPGWTSYRDLLNFSTVDITERLAEGSHVLGAWVGPGWYAEYFGFDGDFFRTWRGGSSTPTGAARRSRPMRSGRRRSSARSASRASTRASASTPA